MSQPNCGLGVSFPNTSRCLACVDAVLTSHVPEIMTNNWRKWYTAVNNILQVVQRALHPVCIYGHAMPDLYMVAYASSRSPGTCQIMPAAAVMAINQVISYMKCPSQTIAFISSFVCLFFLFIDWLSVWFLGHCYIAWSWPIVSLVLESYHHKGQLYPSMTRVLLMAS